ncbi:universal stress protein [Amycolatopsis pithecellobii]|uniref:Universal stress protein n=1 Tax=Amycolatopsis pithecellobii TaxID=664692 RepID=A0A6N7ZD50_9PSEU|nr:universal stress protein [Amycolatopsis pithecellobii]MTD59606.1 universal stress protein [Amycolatopsis pithecellobii]
MTRKGKIIVGVDGSTQSEAALRWAIDEARTDGAQVRAVLVRSREDLLPGTSYSMQAHGRRPVGEDEDYAHLLRATVEKSLSDKENLPEIHGVVTDGDPATELIKESGDADLLVVGSHGARMLTELLLGSVATQCVRHAHCPVVVLTGEAAQRQG